MRPRHPLPRDRYQPLCTCRVPSSSPCPKPRSPHESSHIKAPLSSTRTHETLSLWPPRPSSHETHFISLQRHEKNRGAAVLKGRLIYSLSHLCTHLHVDTHADTHDPLSLQIMICYHQSSSGQAASNLTIKREHLCHEKGRTVL